MSLDSNDYRKIKAARVWTRDVLIKMLQDHKEGFTTRMIADGFTISMKDAQMRVMRLQKWGCIKAQSRAVKPIRWAPTKWGLKMAEIWKNGK